MLSTTNSITIKPNYSSDGILLNKTNISMTNGTYTYTATESCLVYINLDMDANSSGGHYITINDIQVSGAAMGNVNAEYRYQFTAPFILSKGDVLKLYVNTNRSNHWIIVFKL